MSTPLFMPLRSCRLSQHTQRHKSCCQEVSDAVVDRDRSAVESRFACVPSASPSTRLTVGNMNVAAFSLVLLRALTSRLPQKMLPESQLFHHTQHLTSFLRNSFLFHPEPADNQARFEASRVVMLTDACFEHSQHSICEPKLFFSSMLRLALLCNRRERQVWRVLFPRIVPASAVWEGLEGTLGPVISLN